MASKTFLELVNNVIDEGKITPDPLTSANFASPPRTAMYDRIKRWINMAYKELMLKREDWHFRNERATVNIWPRLHLSGLTYTPSAGDVLEGASSGVRFTVLAVHSHEDVEQDPTLEVTVSVEFADGANPENLLIKESVDRISPSPAVDVGYLKGWGTYDMRPLVNQLQSVDLDHVYLHRTPSDAVLNDGAFINNSLKLIPLRKEQWYSEYEMYPWTGAYPRYIVETTQGVYDFYPRPKKEFLLSFNFNRKIPEMVNYNDTPDGLPEEYQDYLMWRALQEYADYDNNQTLWRRASKHVEEYLNWLDRDEKPIPRIADSKFYV